MRLPRPFYRLAVRFDAERLRAEVEELPDSAWATHPAGFPGNASLRLISTDGGENDDLRGPMAATPHLRACAYVRQVLGSFGVVWGRSRLMRLAPGAKVPEHADASWHWYNRVRLHVPIRTHPDVRFHCDGEAVHMAAGEAWIFDNWRRHHVDNDSDVERIHLVADTSGTAAFWSMVAQSDAAAVTPRRVTYDARRDVQVVVERTPPRPVMPPAEVELLLNDFVAELVMADGQGAASEPVQRWIGLLNGFTCDWRQLYLLHGEAPARSYIDLRESLRAALAPLAAGLVMATNRSPALAVLESRLLQHLLDPGHEAAAHGTGQRNTAAQTPAREQAAGRATGQRVRPTPPPRPLFIIAAPRSGSTLLFETLAVSPQFCTLGGEAHWLVEQFPALRPGAPGVDSNRLEAPHASPGLAAEMSATIWPRLRDQRGRPVAPEQAARMRWLEKTPKNALRVPFLRALFPDAQFLLLWRDPRPNIASIVEAWRAGGWVTYPSLPDWEGPWSMLLPPGYPALRGCPLHEVAAWQWDQANATALSDLAQLPEACWTALRYEELTADPARVVRDVCEFAGLEFDRELRERTSASLPPSRHTLTPPTADKWRVHARDLEAALPRCSDTWVRLQALGVVIRRSETRIAG